MRYSFKWNKQQILMDFHIRDVDSFEKNVKVFSKYNKREAIDFIIEQQYRFCDCSEVYFILILVPIEHRYKLKNIVIKNRINLNHIYKLLEEEQSSYSEIWVCTNRLKLGESFSGRFCIDCLKGFDNQILEIISEDTPRFIENIECFHEGKAENQIEYYLYSRNCWGMRYKEFVVQNKGKCMGDVNIQICRAIENLD